MPDDSGDLSERLLRQVGRLTDRLRAAFGKSVAEETTQLLFREDIPKLEKVISSYIGLKKEIWLLIDNLDKGWPTRGATPEDVMILRTLLEAARKLQRQFESDDIDFRCVVFIRNDIHELLVRTSPDRDKDTAVTLDWDDAEAFKEVVRQRIAASTGLSGSFDQIWPHIATRHIVTQDSFGYIVERTLMRPRDVLRFLRRAVEVAVNRGHARIEADDILAAEESYSEELLLGLNFEIGDVSPHFVDLLYNFIRVRGKLHLKEVDDILQATVPASSVAEALMLLVWFGFLGTQTADGSDPEYSYQVRYNVPKLMAAVNSGKAYLVIHPAFRSALGCVASTGGDLLPFSG